MSVLPLKPQPFDKNRSFSLMIQLAILVVVTLVIAYRLYTELGKRDHQDQQRPSDWHPNVLGRGPQEENQDAPAPMPNTSDPVSKSNLSPELSQALDDIAAQDSGFNYAEFEQGARAAFEMILNAFSQGDRDTLSSLLAKDVYKDFDGAIKDREAKNQTLETSLVGFTTVEATQAEIDQGAIFITMRYVTEQGFVLKAEDGSVLETSGAQIDEIIDIWTFTKKLNSKDPVWTLIVTETEDA